MVAVLKPKKRLFILFSNVFRGKILSFCCFFVKVKGKGVCVQLLTNLSNYDTLRGSEMDPIHVCLSGWMTSCRTSSLRHAGCPTTSARMVGFFDDFAALKWRIP